MPVVRLFSNLIRSTFCLLVAVVFASCGISDDEAFYSGDEEAVREHMQEVEDDERAHFQQTPQVEATATMFPQERPGGN
jgi:hypothetical protein